MNNTYTATFRFLLSVMSAAPPVAPQVIVVNQPRPTKQRKHDVIPGYNAKTSRQIGMVVLVVAVLSVAVGITDVVIQGYRNIYTSPYYCHYSSWASCVAAGIWSGVIVSLYIGACIGTLSLLLFSVFWRALHKYRGYKNGAITMLVVKKFSSCLYLESKAVNKPSVR